MEKLCRALVSPKTDSSFFAYDLILGIPAILLLIFLGWKLRACCRKLQRSQSQIMATYYCVLWLVALFNGVRVLVQLLEGFSQKHVLLWNSLWLLTRFGLVLSEVSVLVFLLQGSSTSGNEALFRTLVVSGALAFLETLVMGVMVAKLHEPLFFYGGTEELSWSKWGFWLGHGLLFLLLYSALLVLPFTRWRALLPAKAAFHRYVLVLLGVNLFGSIGAVLLGTGHSGGYCIYGLSNFVYYALYPPLLYLTFLAEFFQNTASDLDMLLYSEMKDAGVFESRECEF